MTHRIEDAVVVPLLWDDDEGQWEIDPEALTGALQHADERTGVRGGCSCQEATEGGETSQEHDEQWGRACAAPLPTLADLVALASSQEVRNGNVRALHPRPISDQFRLQLMAKVESAYDGSGRVAPGDVVDRIIPLIQSVDENAHRRGRYEARNEIYAQRLHGKMAKVLDALDEVLGDHLDPEERKQATQRILQAVL